MKRSHVLSCLITLLIGILISVSNSAGQDSRQLVNPASQGSLELIIGAGDSPSYIEEWIRTRSDTPARVQRIKETSVEKTVYLGFIITGYAVEQASNMNCLVDVKIYSPDGTLLFDLKNYSKAKRRVSNKGFVMADPALDFTLEQSDPAGKYRIEGTVKDQIADKRATSTYEIELKK